MHQLMHLAIARRQAAGANRAILHRGRRRRRQTPTAGTGRAHNGCAPLAASSPDPTPRGRRRDQGGRSHARVDRAHRDGIITGAGALASNAQPAAPARQQAAETSGPQMRGGTVDAVDAADDGIALPRSLEIAIARRLSHRRISRARSRRARSRSTIEPDSMLRPRAQQSIRSSCTRRFRASSATTDTTRVEQSWDAGSTVRRRTQRHLRGGSRQGDARPSGGVHRDPATARYAALTARTEQEDAPSGTTIRSHAEPQ